MGKILLHSHRVTSSESLRPSFIVLFRSSPFVPSKSPSAAVSMGSSRPLCLDSELYQNSPYAEARAVVNDHEDPTAPETSRNSYSDEP